MAPSSTRDNGRRMWAFFQAGAVFGFFDVVTARAYAPLALEDAMTLFFFPIGFFAVLGLGLDLAGRALSAARGRRTAIGPPVPLALAACLLPVVIEGLRGCLRGCGFTPGQWGLRFLPTLLLVAALIGGRRFLRDPKGRSASLLVFLSGA